MSYRIDMHDKTPLVDRHPRKTIGHRFVKEVNDWCVENNVRPHQLHTFGHSDGNGNYRRGWSVYFDTDREALLFKLRWL